MTYYPITIEMDEDVWLVTSPDFPEVITFGETLEDAHHRACDAIEEAVAARISDKQALPIPRDEQEAGQYAIQLPALSFLKSLLYMLCRIDNVSRAELCRRLEWNRESVDRLFRLDHKSQLGQMEDAFQAIGHPLQMQAGGDSWRNAA